jgi:phosphoribosylformylglycinamidine (FGAM) synthase-like enzyme
MTPYEMMLSESQERMLMVLKPGKEPMAQAIFEKVGTGLRGDRRSYRYRPHGAEWNGDVVCDIPLGPLADDAPLYDRPAMSRGIQGMGQSSAAGRFPIESSDIGSGSAQDDGLPRSRQHGAGSGSSMTAQVGADTLQKSAAMPLWCASTAPDKALAISTDCTPRYCYADPYEGGKQAIAETYRNLSSRWGPVRLP